MGKPAFDPNQPFERADGGGGKPVFDPNQPFSTEATDSAPGAAQSALEHYGNSATLGYLPHLQAGAESLMPDPSSELNARLKAAGFSIDEPGTDYLASRDANIARLAQEKAAHPTASMAGTGAGIVGNALLTGGALKAAGLVGKGATLAGGLEGPVTQGAARLKNYLDAAKLGAVMGAGQNPGDTEGEINPVQLPERVTNAGVGIPLGLAGNAASELISGAPAAAKYLKELANEKAFKVLGAGKRAFKEAFAKDQVQSMGRQLLDEPGMMNVLQTPKGLAAKVEASKDAAGGEIGSILDRVDAANAARAAAMPETGGYPATMSPDYSSVVAAEMTPMRVNGAPEHTAEQLSQMRGLSGPVQESNLSAANEAGYNPYVKPPKVTKPGMIDTAAMADDLSGGGFSKKMGLTPGAEGVNSSFQQSLDTLKKNGDISLRQAQALRGDIDGQINWGKLDQSAVGKQQGLYEIRDSIRNKMNDVVNESKDIAASGQKDALLKANRRYSALADMDRILDDKIAGDASRRTYRLGDHLSSGTGASVGAVIGGPPGAAIGGFAGGSLSKLGRTFGNSMGARGYDALANILAQLPPGVGEAVSQNPGALQSILASLAGPQAMPPQLPPGGLMPMPKLGGAKKAQNRTPFKSATRLKALEE